MAEPVTETLCVERMKLQDERFKRDTKRLDALEETCKKEIKISDNRAIRDCQAV